MRKSLSSLLLLLLIISCKQSSKSREVILPSSSGNTNKILVVLKANDWDGKVGDEIRVVFGEHQVGLPQPETLLNVGQIDPAGFKGFIKHSKAILICRKGKEEQISIERNKYAEPQIIVYATAKNEKDLVGLIRNRGKEIIKIFQEEDIKFIQSVFKSERMDERQFKTIQNLNVKVDIPKRYNLVEDKDDFLWLRQHLKSGIARGDGSNNILIYSVPYENGTNVADNISAMRDMIGEKYIPGGKEGMYMITEQAYTPHTNEIEFDGRKAFETRGKWEVKNDFMAGPFLNYTIIDEKNKRLVVFEGFTYAPSVNKRNFVFELEAIAKTLKIK